MRELDPVTPGELLREEFLVPMSISQYRLAKEIDVPSQRISEIVNGKRSITADTDLRLVVSSAFPRVIGFEPRPPMIPKWRRRPSLRP